MTSGTQNVICPCGTFEHPRVIFNPPGRDVIAYRDGDFATFRRALLRALDDEQELTQRTGDGVVQIWHPSAQGDLALQMIEWWAYLADVLTFYNERVATQAYLRTADLPESVNRLIQILGYRPRPAIGATGVVAALASSLKPFTLPKGFPIQSKPGPGKQPQVFELQRDTTVNPRDSVGARPDTSAGPVTSDSAAVLLKGKVGTIKAGDKLLLKKASDGQWLTVKSIDAKTDPSGKPVTQVTFGETLSLDGSAHEFQLLRSGQSTVPWTLPQDSQARLVIMANAIELAGVVRGIHVGDAILLEAAAGNHPPTLVTVTAYSETIWYAHPASPPPQSPPSASAWIPIPHSHIEFNPGLTGDWNSNASSVTVHYSWTVAGELVPVLTPQDNVISGAGSVVPAVPVTLPSGTSAPVLVEDALGDGALADAAADSSNPPLIALDNVSSLPPAGLTAPISLLFNLLPVSRGKTVPSEVLGSGDATLLGQDFVLKNAPVTYLQDPASRSGENYSSTVQVWVNGIAWREVRSFYGQPSNAQVFMTREDEQGKTHVAFATRLPTGVNNVVASYRYGGGAEVPAAGTLTNILQPWPGLKSLRNPVPPGGAADPDPPAKIKTLAPRSVMTFDRAVSLDDYEVIAGSAPGVARAKAAYGFDPVSQRPSVTVWVGDDAGAVAAAQAALAAGADPNRPINVKQAMRLENALSLTCVRDPRFDDAMVKAGVHAALLDPDTGLFGANRVGIGQPFYDSQICAACLAVPGVTAVHNLVLTRALFHLELEAMDTFASEGLRIHRFGRHHFVEVRPSRPAGRPGLPRCRGHRYDPGPGSYFFIPDNDDHLNLASTVVA
jgi:hypothetical protein